MSRVARPSLSYGVLAAAPFALLFLVCLGLALAFLRSVHRGTPDAPVGAEGTVFVTPALRPWRPQ